MKLIDQYVYAVTRHLPSDQQEDVAKELTVTIEDMAADRAKGKEPTHKIVESVLAELGEPEVLAQRYTKSSRYLIGPKWFSIYVRLLARLAIMVPLAVMALTAVLQFTTVLDTSITSKVVAILSAGFITLVQVGFWTTIVCVILELTGVDPLKTALVREWKASDLPEVPKKRQISRADAIAGMVFTAIVAVLVAIAPFMVIDLSGESMLIFNLGLWQLWIPLFLILSALAIMLDVFKYYIGNWTPVLAAINVLLCVASGVYLVVFVLTQQLFDPAFMEWVRAHSTVDNLGTILRLAVGATVVITLVSIAASAIDSVRKALQLR